MEVDPRITTRRKPAEEQGDATGMISNHLRIESESQTRLTNSFCTMQDRRIVIWKWYIL